MPGRRAASVVYRERRVSEDPKRLGAIYVAQTVGEDDFNPAGRGVDGNANLLRERNQDFPT